jgi:OHCU decarboxylase
MYSIDTLTTISREGFAEALQPLFEAAEPLADALYAGRPYTTYAALIETAESVARCMPFDDQVAVLSAHPRIGADPATVSAASYQEQGYLTETGLDQAQLESTYSQLAQLNAEYERQFGFRFVVFVNGRSKAAIVEVLKERLTHSREVELDAGLRAMFQIARARLMAPSNTSTSPARVAAGARSIAGTSVPDDDPARQSILDELRHLAVETYGEDRAAEATLQTALQFAATVVWRVTQEPLEPGGSEP